jgi:hypothetical protein
VIVKIETIEEGGDNSEVFDHLGSAAKNAFRLSAKV